MVLTHENPPGVLFVEPHVLRRVIRRHRGLSGFGLQVLHGDVYTLPRAALLAIASPDELGAAADALADEPILLPKDGAPPSPTEVWRKVLHARVHQAIAARGLTAAMLKERIHEIGQVELDEIRYVLRKEDRLLPPRDELETYAELAALYLELRHFAPGELAHVFPTLGDGAALDAVLAHDVDGAALLAASRPAGAPPAPAPAPRSPHPPGATPVVTPRPGDAAAAAVARARGNLSRAAILARRAGDRAAARGDLAALVARLDLPRERHAAWASALEPIVDAAAAAPGMRRTATVRLLHDLVKAATDREREPADVDVLDCVLSLGRRPLVRRLPLAQPVRHARHLAAAAEKLARARVADGARAPLAALLHEAAADAARRARAALLPPLAAALDEVGLSPSNVPERVARKKLEAELLDGVLARGFFHLGHLRDAISRSALNLPDLSGPLEWLRGDPLLRADARLAHTLDGVYRRGEIYLRGLQRLSSLFFATRPGRALTLYLLLPFIGAFVALEGLAHIVGPLAHALAGVHPRIFSWPAVGVLALALFALLHSRAARAGAVSALRAVAHALHAGFVAAPRAVWRSPPVQAVVRSPTARVAWQIVVKPGIVAGALVAVAGPAVGAAAFFALALLLNSRLGAAVEERVADGAVRAGRHVGLRLVPGLIALVLDLFRTLMELIDRALYAVDELLRFRAGDRRPSVFVKAVLGSVWGAITYVVRIYLTLLIEPTVNPIKHFPVVTVAGKIMLPLSPALLQAMRAPLAPLVGAVAASSIAGAHLLLLPGVFGFLVWELKENWRLYAANRPRALRPVLIGSHGETMGALLRPGLHSGTVPKLYAKLRRATWRGDPVAARHEEALHHVAEAVARFVERELVALLDEARWGGGRLAVGRVELAGNRLRVALAVAGAAPATLTFEEQSDWLLGSLERPGFVAALAPGDRAAFDDALRGLYKLAGVELVREQLAAALPPGAPYDVADEGLVVWANDYHSEAVYRLRGAGERLAAEVRGPKSALPPELGGSAVFFSRHEIAWRWWTERWSGYHITV